MRQLCQRQVDGAQRKLERLRKKGRAAKAQKVAEVEDGVSAVAAGGLSQEVVDKVHHLIEEGHVGKAAACLQEQVVVVTKQRCYRVSPDGTLWAKVLRKVDALHPKPREPLTLDHHRSDHATGEWATVLSPEMHQIHFALKGIFFFKGTAEQWAVIEADHEAAHDNWTLRPIAIGTCHHRCIARGQVLDYGFIINK